MLEKSSEARMVVRTGVNLTPGLWKAGIAREVVGHVESTVFETIRCYV